MAVQHAAAIMRLTRKHAEERDADRAIASSRLAPEATTAAREGACACGARQLFPAAVAPSRTQARVQARTERALRTMRETVVALRRELHQARSMVASFLLVALLFFATSDQFTRRPSHHYHAT
jgi:hypothetical protein